MTRINCVPPSELTGPHLVAEYRELPRVYKLARNAIKRGTDPQSLPSTYRMGSGHVSFFYTRLGYIRKRQAQLIVEMQARGYRTMYNKPESIDDLPAEWCNDWQPDEAALATSRARIQERLNGTGKAA